MMNDEQNSIPPAVLTAEELTELVRSRIQAILRVVQLESAGESIEPTGFRFQSRSSQCGS
jgi:hypothetical protein